MKNKHPKAPPNKPPNERELLQALLDVTTTGFVMVAAGFESVVGLLSKILEVPTTPPTTGGLIFNVLGGVPRARMGGSMPLEVTCSVSEAFRIQVKPVTLTGKPAQIQSGSLAVTPNEPGENVALAKAQVETDDTFVIAANLVDGATGGWITFAVSGDADLGSGVVELTDEVTLNVTTEMASNLGVTAVGAVSRDSVAMPK